jgi:dUTP pyrophosphatase
MIKVPVKLKRGSPNVPRPKYETPGASAFDIRAWFPQNLTGVLEVLPGSAVAIPTGLFMAIPEGYELQIRPRSGLSLKTRMRIANSPGTIDSDYRGEICVILDNTGSDRIRIHHLDRIAQGAVCPIVQAEFEDVDELTDTERGEGGFGSTGVS